MTVNKNTIIVKNKMRSMVDSTAFFLFFITLISHLVFWNTYPPGFTADEATEGFDAFNLVRTGKDQFGTPFPILFRSFGDYRSPFNIWVTTPFIAVFGLTSFATRIPSMIAASFEVTLVYLLGKYLFSQPMGIISAFLLMGSPWFILHTRFAQQVNIGTLNILGGMMYFLWWTERKKSAHLYLSTILFAASIYSYQNSRITMPILGLACFLLFHTLIMKYLRTFFKACLIFFLILSPLGYMLFSNPNLVLRRASAQSVFSDSGISGALWHDIVTMPAGYPIWLSRLQHNKPIYYGRAILKGYLSHFNPTFLFFSGDSHERFRTPYSGLLNWIMLLFLPIGFILFLRRGKGHRLILLWLFTSPIVASLSTIVPNSQHAQDMMIPLHLVGGAGAVWFFDHASYLKRVLVIALFVVSFSLFLYGYTQIIPHETKYLQAWHYYGNLFKKLSPFYGRKIVFLGGQYYINLAFFLKYDPETFQREVRISRPDNLAEFDHVESFGSYEFRKTRDIPTKLNSETLYVRLNEEGELVPNNVTVVDREFWPDGKREYVVFKLSNDSND